MARWRAFDRLGSVPKQRFSDEVILFADSDGALKTVDEDGTVTSVGSDVPGGSVPFVGAAPPDSPTDGELWWDPDDDTAPSGGSQPGVGVLYGPYPVDFSDIPNDQDDLTLFTPTAGQVVLASLIDPRTITAPVSNGAAAILIGQATELPVDGAGLPTTGTAAWAGLDTDIIFDNFRSFATSAMAYPADVPSSGFQPRMAAIFPLNEAVVARNNSGDDLTAGSCDVYFVIAEAVAP